jgi:hypothetical protein
MAIFAPSLNPSSQSLLVRHYFGTSPRQRGHDGPNAASGNNSFQYSSGMLSPEALKTLCRTKLCAGQQIKEQEKKRQDAFEVSRKLQVAIVTARNDLEVLCSRR